MSKIQKAIQAMRASKDADATGRANAEKFVSRHGPNVSEPRTRRSVRPASEASDAAFQRNLEMFEEQPVVNKLSIDRNELLRAGFWLEGTDAENIAEQFQRAKRPLIHSSFEMGVPIGENSNVIMVTSAMPGAGKSFCSFNLVRSIAKERDVGAVLVDADVLKRSVSRGFGVSDKPGLMDYLVDEEMSIDDILFETDVDGIILVPAGEKHPQAAELLSSRRMKQLVQELSQRFRTRAIILDTPPMLVTNEAHVLATHVGQIVFVIEARVSSQESVLQALGSLDRSKPINAILNKSRTASGSGYYGDDYGYYPFNDRGRDDVELTTD